ncbi:MAG TPA: hypothetical protein VNI77_09530 [Nitrososphaera sp.]|nr:hypothetical protein [Nitrososphaera sp.]
MVVDCVVAQLTTLSRRFDELYLVWPSFVIRFYTRSTNGGTYNESMVKRGEVMIDLDLIDGWHDDGLEKMSEGKEGTYAHTRTYAYHSGNTLTPLSSCWGTCWRIFSTCRTETDYY